MRYTQKQRLGDAKRVRIVVIAGTILATLWLCTATRPFGVAKARAAADQAPFAQVERAAIPQKDLDLEKFLLRKTAELVNRPLTEERLNELTPFLLQTLSERESLYQAAQKRNINVTKRVVDQTLKEFKQWAPLQNIPSGLQMADADLRTYVRKGLTVERLLYLDVLRNIGISEPEIQREMIQPSEFVPTDEQVHARHILIACKINHDEDRRKALERIAAAQAALAAGSPFGLVAYDYSDCPSRIRGGDLGYLARDALIADFAEAAFSLPPDQISDVVETRLGFHLIEVLGRRPGPLINRAMTRKAAEERLIFKKESAAIQSYAKRLRSRADKK